MNVGLAGVQERYGDIVGIFDRGKKDANNLEQQDQEQDENQRW
jgi:hypothetical protein